MRRRLTALRPVSTNLQARPPPIRRDESTNPPADHGELPARRLNAAVKEHRSCDRCLASASVRILEDAVRNQTCNPCCCEYVPGVGGWRRRVKRSMKSALWQCYRMRYQLTEKRVFKVSIASRYLGNIGSTVLCIALALRKGGSGIWTNGYAVRWV